DAAAAALRLQLRVEGVQAGYVDEDRRTRRAVAVVLGQVQPDAAPRDLHVEREARLEAMFPVDAEAQQVDVEGLGLGDVEDAQDGRGPLEGDCLGGLRRRF